MAHLHILTGQSTAQLRRVAAVARHVEERGFLRSMVITDGQSLHLLQRRLAGAIRLDQSRGNAGQLQTARHHQRHNAEARCNVLDRDACIRKLLERGELIRRMHIHPLNVLRQARSQGHGLRHHQTHDRCICRQLLLLGQRLQFRQTAPAGGHVIETVFRLDHDQILQQPLTLDARLQRAAAFFRHCLGPDVPRPATQLRQRNLLPHPTWNALSLALGLSTPCFARCSFSRVLILLLDLDVVVHLGLLLVLLLVLNLLR
ncbi:hypothetical protein D9M68_721070 [compost metagenome]